MKPNSQMKLDRYFRQCVGIDVSKDKFTACLFMYDMASDVGCCTESVDFPNSKTGFNQMVKWSRKEAQKGFLLTYLMEPTGSYYEPLAYHLHKIGLTLYVVLPNKARSFCEYEGIKTKTDAMDARCLALLGCKNQRLRPWQPPKAIYRELRQLTRLRASLTKMQTQIMNHIEAIDHMESVTLEVCKSYKKLLSTIQKQLEQNEQAIAAKVAQDKELEGRIPLRASWQRRRVSILLPTASSSPVSQDWTWWQSSQVKMTLSTRSLRKEMPTYVQPYICQP